MSQNPPEFTGSQRRRLNREYKRNVRQGTKDAKAALTLKRSDRRRIDPAFREALGRSNLTAADLSAMMQRSVTGTQNAQARAELGALGQAAQQRIRAPRTETPSLSGMVANAYSRWRDLRRGTKLLKAASALAAKDVKTVDPLIRAQLGHSTLTRQDLSQLAQRNLIQAFRDPGDFEVRPGEQAAQPQLQNNMIQSRENASRGPIQQVDAGRLDMLRGEIRQLREQIALLEQQVAQLEAEQAELETPEVEAPEVETPEVESPEAQAPEAQSPEVQSPEAQSPEAQSPEAQQPEVQTPEAQTPEAQQPTAQSTEGQTAQTQQPEAQSPEVQSPEAQSPEAQTPEAQRADSAQNVGQHQAVPTDRAEAQQWVAANTGENQPAAQQPGQQPQVQQPAAQAQTPDAQRADSAQNVGQHQAVPADRAEAQQWLAAQQAQAQERPGQQQPRGTAQPVFQAAGEQPTTRPGQPQRPSVEQPVFQAAGEQPNESIRKAEIARAAAATYDGTASPRAGTREQAAKTAESDPNKRADRGAGHSAAQKNDPNGRGAR